MGEANQALLQPPLGFLEINWKMKTNINTKNANYSKMVIFYPEYRRRKPFGFLEGIFFCLEYKGRPLKRFQNCLNLYL
jgi:hypothetical protein